MRAMAIRCARCGQLLEPKVAEEESKTRVGPVPLLDPREVSAGAPTSHAGDEETLAPSASPRPLSSTFLSSAKNPGELGWLAHYRVVRLLGQGGMGVVFEAIDTHLERPVALKVMKPESAEDESARQRFLREARALAAVKNEHVVTVHHVGEANRLPYLAMEFLQGQPLDDWLKTRGRPSVAEIIELGMQIGDGLSAAHERGLIHRDIKPANIFLEKLEHPPRFRAKILDFGLARVLQDRGNLTDPGRVIGTPGYMAPEQVEGLAVDARSDLFSLGCILYELSTGVQPFAASNAVAILMAVLNRTPQAPAELNRDLPAGLVNLIERLMAREPGRRPASARAVVEALHAVVGSPTTSWAVKGKPRAWRWLLAALALLAILLTALLAWWLIH